MHRQTTHAYTLPLHACIHNNIQKYVHVHTNTLTNVYTKYFTYALYMHGHG